MTPLNDDSLSSTAWVPQPNRKSRFRSSPQFFIVPTGARSVPSRSNWDHRVGLRIHVDVGPVSGSVDTPLRLAGFRARGARTGIPAALRYALAVSRRTVVDFSIWRRLQSSRPSARTCWYLWSLERF